MTRAFVLSVVVVLAACGRHAPVLTVEALVHHPQRLYTLRHRCAVARTRVGNATCALMDEAYARRFFLGLGGPDEYQALASLPPIPASFDQSDEGTRP